MLASLLSGLSFASDPLNILSIIGGVITGIFVGALPGVSPSVGLAVMIPITFSLSPEKSLLILASIYCGGMFGGSIPAILLRTPGSGAAAATVFDGYELAKQGKAGKALGMAIVSSTIGGTISVIILILLAPQLANVAIRFGPAEYFALAVFGLSIIVRMSAKQLLKGLIAAGFGLFISTIGSDPITAFERYTFGFSHLYDGIHFLPPLIGLFAISEVFKRFSILGEQKSNYIDSVATELPNKSEILECMPAIGRSSLIGTLVGILPGAGGTIASFIGYNEGMRFSKHPERFGHGTLEGVAAAEAANNAASGGAFVPLLALGIPGSSATAIILGAFLIHGLQAGPLLFTRQTDLVYTLFAGMLIAQLVMLIIGLFSAKMVSRVIGIPYEILGTLILVLSSVGAYVINYSILDLWIAFLFGLIGYWMNKFEFPAAPMVLAIILGPLMEISLRRALIITGGNFISLFNKPIVLVLFTLAIISVLSPFLGTFRKILRKK